MLEGVSHRSFGGSSGTYNVRASELARHKALTTLRLKVVFLDETSQVFELEKSALGSSLLELVFTHLELLEKDFFGLQYLEKQNIHDDRQMRWLDPQKSIKKQLRIRTKTLGTCALPVLHFRVKFWVSDPGKLMEEYTRYHVFLQLRRDILEGRLHSPPSTQALLASYALQSEIGDYNPEVHGNSYIMDMKMLQNHNEDILKKVIELHKLHKGLTPADAEFTFLDHAKRLDLYGVDLHNAKDSTNREIHLGVTSIGLVVFQNNVKMNTFSWAKIVKISFKRKQFFIQLRREVVEQNDKAVENNDKEYLNKSVEHSEKTTTPSFLQIVKNKLSQKSERYDSVLGFNLPSYRECKFLWKSCVEHHTFFRLHTPRPLPVRKHMLTLGSKFRYSGRTEYQTVEDCKRRARVERTFARSPSKRFSQQPIPPVPLEVKEKKVRSSSGSSLRPRSDSSSYKVTSVSGEMAPKMAWGEATLTNGEDSMLDGEDQEHSSTTREDISTVVPPQVIQSGLPLSSSSSTSSIDDTHELISSSTDSKATNGDESSHGLMTIRMQPDGQGKFGFNVKGGADQNLAILVSRVVPNTPADRCYPRLNEGDQVLFINGRDVSTMSHEQVVNFIRASRECHTGELVLTVKQNVYLGPEDCEEPAFQYVPESLGPASATVPAGSTAPLQESMLLLAEGLESGAVVAQFEQLYRRKPGLILNEARKQENEKKNRYRDISPYDTTRVILTSPTTGDYINGSYVNMEIPGSGIINRYIACQGPLSTTCTDFWVMIWEQQSTLIVMLTTVVEQGRVKCHRYWPRLYESTTFGSLQVTCLKEEETASFAFRQFTLIDTESNVERHISHMQYLAWPDHGVPDDSLEFLDFITQVRQARAGMVEPTIVHCSAGIGRTGVLILMETAQCLIEANEPVYPLDSVRAMRDQRAMMIQTSSQYKFVCEAIQRVFQEGIIKPLSEYQTR